MPDQIKKIIRSSIDVKQQVLQNEMLLSTIKEIADIITAAFVNGNRLYLCGNGGSAADAQHLAAEFSGRFYKNRKTLPAEALHCNTSYLTAVANDFSFDEIYSRMISGVGQPGDILLAISTSGNSANIIRALEAAKKARMITVGFSGQTAGKMKESCDYIINIPSEDTPRIQESHIMVGHIICQLVEEKYFAG